jgi:hypothetical protein
MGVSEIGTMSVKELRKHNRAEEAAAARREQRQRTADAVTWQEGERRKARAKASPKGRFGFDWREGIISACDLAKKEFPELAYIIPGILPEGVTLLVGRPKIGKSWWVLDLCIAVAGGTHAMGSIEPGVVGEVLYLALEDNQRRLKRRLKKLGKEPPVRLQFHTEWARADRGGIEALREWRESHPDARLIVIDTLAAIRPQGGPDGYSKDYTAIEGLQKLAGEMNISILVLHHDRKAEAEDAFDTVSGTLGLTGAADAIMMLKRDPGSAMCVLHGRGRDIEEFERGMSFSKETCIWRLLGDASEERQSKERRRIIEAIGTLLAESGSPAQPPGPKDIATACGMKLGNVKVLLGKMAADGAVERVGKGLYKLPKARAEWFN